MSLNSVVNNLVRAAAGIPQDISDTELDAHVAKLLADEAKAKEKNWTELGLSGLLSDGRDSPDPNAPKPNKRFLASVIRTVDGHNSALLRAQAEAARDVRISRGESSRGGASRLFGGAMQSVGRDDSGRRRRDERVRDRDGHGEGDREGRRSRGDEKVYRERETREKESRRRYDTRDHLDRGYRTRRDKRELDEEEYFNRKQKPRDHAVDRDGDTHSSDKRRRRKNRDEEEDEEQYFNDESMKSKREEDERYMKIRREQGERDKGERWTDWYEREKDIERRRRRGSSDEEEHWDVRRERDNQAERKAISAKAVDEEEAVMNGSALHTTLKAVNVAEDESVNEDIIERKTREETREKKETRHRKDYDDPLSEDDEPKVSKKRSRRAEDAEALPLSSLSKMDKYFDTGYDPRLDLGAVPKEGMVAEVGWDNMLAILKERGQKRRHQSPTLSDDGYNIPKNVSLRATSPDVDTRKLEKTEKKKRKEERRKKRGDSDEDEEDREKRKAAKGMTESTGSGLFDIPYVKKGGVREWDVGK